MYEMKCGSPKLESKPNSKKPGVPKNGSSEKGMDRRDFLVGAAAITAAIGFETARNKLANPLKDLGNKLSAKDELAKTLDAYRKDDELRQLENAKSYIGADDDEIIGKTFQEQLRTKRSVTLDKASRNAILHNWEKKYAPGSLNYKDGLVKGLERMRPWANDIKKIFERYGVPEEHMYLAIAESHFGIGEISEAGAVGPYQITKDTSQLQGFQMIVTGDYDERLDPLKSAELCAKHLRHNYERFRNNWDLAVLAYNGGYVNKFVESLSEKELRTPKEDIRIQKASYEFQDKDTFSKIAEKYNTSLTLLYKVNADPKESFKGWMDRIRQTRPGAKILIPQERNIDLESFYQWLEAEINKKIEQELSDDSYTVRSGDTLESIAKKFHMDADLLSSLNQNVRSFSLRAKEKLHIPLSYKKSDDMLMETLGSFKENINYPGKFHAIVKIIRDNHLDLLVENPPKSYLKMRLAKKTSLIGISRQEGIEMEKLQEFNPAIKRSSLTIPSGYEIRLPVSYLIAKTVRKKN